MRCLQAFLSSFVLENSVLRLGPSPAPSSKAHRELLQTLEQVASGRRARYAHYKDAAAFVLGFVCDLRNTVTTMHAFVSALMPHIFGPNSAIANAI